MKTFDGRNRILLFYVILMLGLFAYEHFVKAGTNDEISQLMMN
jgi:hypothetical protein